MITSSNKVILQTKNLQEGGREGGRWACWQVRASWSHPVVVLSPHFPDVTLQIDFPTSAFDIKFTSPAGDKFSPRYEFGSLREEDQHVLKNIMQKESLHW